MLKYLLFVVLIDSNGYEQMRTVSNIEHNDKLSCLVEKAEHKDVSFDTPSGDSIENRIIFFCGKNTEYFNKHKKLY